MFRILSTTEMPATLKIKATFGKDNVHGYIVSSQLDKVTNRHNHMHDDNMYL